MSSWSDRFWTSPDGLKLHYRDYPGRADRAPILCLPGLTRNGRDFEGVADRLAGERRMLLADFRGRGESAFARSPAEYVPSTYVEDVEALVEQAGLGPVILFGTSLGGIVTMLLASRGRVKIAGALLNDIGPRLEARGLDHIRTYVGRPQTWPTWLHAARALCEVHRDRYPDWGVEEWLIFAKRVARLNESKRVVLDYDMRIAEPFRDATPADFDLWPAFAALAGIPTLLLRGALSDLISTETVERMKEVHGALEAVVVDRVGHAPTLEEPEAVAAIDRLLERV